MKPGIIVLISIISLILVLIIISFVIEKVHRENFHEPNELDKYIKFVYNPTHQQKLLKMLKIFHKICVENDIPYWITGGTSLGQIRHNGFIPHDDDLDLAVPIDHIDKLLSICKSQFSIKSRSKNSYYKLIDNYDNNLFIDVFPVENDNGYYTFVKKAKIEWNNQKWHVSEIFPLKESQFNNIIVFQPNNVKPYIERTFGKNWNDFIIVTHVHNIFSLIAVFLKPKQKLKLTDSIREIINNMNNKIKA